MFKQLYCKYSNVSNVACRGFMSNKQRVFFSVTTQSLQKADVKLIAEIRKKMQISMSKAKDALVATNNDLQAALEWLEKDAVVSGAAKAEKLAGREAKDGLVGVVVGSQGSGGALVEVNSETDFVARNELFGKLVTQIAATSMFLGMDEAQKRIKELIVDDVAQIPLLPHPESNATESTKTISESISELVGKVGENIRLKRVHVAPLQTKANIINVTGGYVHSTGQGSHLGRLGALVVLEAKGAQAISRQGDLVPFAKSLAQHVVGFAPETIEGEGETSLYSQPYFMGGGTVKQVVDKTAQDLKLDSLQVVDMIRYELGN